MTYPGNKYIIKYNNDTGIVPSVIAAISQARSIFKLWAIFVGTDRKNCMTVILPIKYALVFDVDYCRILESMAIKGDLDLKSIKKFYFSSQR